MVGKAAHAGKRNGRREPPRRGRPTGHPTVRRVARRAARVLACVACAALLLAAGCDREAAWRTRVAQLSAQDRLGGLRVQERAPTVAPPGAERTLTVVATGDLKGWLSAATLDPEREATGLAHLAPLIRELRAGGRDLVLLDAGDALNGAPSVTLGGTPVPPMVAAMNALGYDAMALGNYDLALGWPALQAARAASRFAWLSANGERAGGTALAPYAVLERDGVRVGVLGLTTPAATLGRDPRALEGLAFTSLEAAARRWLPILRDVERVDVLVGLFHSGLDAGWAREEALRAGLPPFAAAGRVAEAVPGFDLIVAGDAQRLSPRRSASGDTPFGVPVLEPGRFGNGIAVATLRLRERGGRWVVAGVERHTQAAAPGPDAALLAALAGPLRRTRERLAEATRVRFRRVPRRGEFYRCAGALSHAVAATQGGGDPARTLSLLPMRWDFVPPQRGELGRPLRRAHLYRWLRYEDTLVQAPLTGRQVALLLDGWVRQEHGWRVPASEVLWPGGLAVAVPQEGSELRDLRRAAEGAVLAPDAAVPVWLTAFVWYGGLGLAPRALLPGGAPLRELPGSLRERLFALLNDPALALPAPCARWLER
jgi:2',3'-cyclic-nucleotide 2'-phosphodiesterase (5'-nucleotidase family)